jgi:hypothetical protein
MDDEHTGHRMDDECNGWVVYIDNGNYYTIGG